MDNMSLVRKFWNFSVIAVGFYIANNGYFKSGLSIMVLSIGLELMFGDYENEKKFFRKDD